MSSCSGEPISWLRLERYQLGELPAAERARVAQHLASCELCNACFSRTRESAELPALPNAHRKSPPMPRAWTRRRWAAALATAALALAGGMLMLRPAELAMPKKPSRLRVKGGELALDLVREHQGTIANDNSHFLAGDRWKALLTCPPEMRPYADLVIFQGGDVFFPLPVARVEHCGNRVALPGAFMLDGDANATACVVVSETAPVDRATLARARSAALPALSLCQSLRPVAAAP